MLVPSNRWLALRPPHALFSLQPPCALSPTLPCTVCPCLPSPVCFSQTRIPGPTWYLLNPSYSPLCTKSNPPLFNLRKLPWCMACVAPGGWRSGFKTASPREKAGGMCEGPREKGPRVSSSGGEGQLSSLLSARMHLVAASEKTHAWDIGSTPSLKQPCQARG